MKSFKIILFLLFLSNYVFAHSVETIPDTIYLEKVVISTNRLVNFSTGTKVSLIDKEKLNLYSSQSIDKILYEQSTLDIKTYGSGGLSTVSMRGAGSGHTAVLWNGFNLQDPMNGSVNLSLIPASFVDNIQMQYGGNGALFGSGAVGGTIYLSNSNKFKQGTNTSIYQSLGSYSNYYSGVNVNYSGEKLVSSIRVFRKKSKNNFSYKNYAQFGSPIEKLDNAKAYKYGLLQTNNIKLTERQTLRTRFWYQNSDKEIQAMMTNVDGNESQNDEFYRVNLNWQYKDNVKSYNARIAFFDNRNIYKNPGIDQITNNNAVSTQGEFESKYRIGNNHIINIGVNGVVESANSEFYGEEKKRDRVSLFSSYKFFNDNNNLASVVSIRKEVVNKKMNPFTFSIGVRAKVFNAVSLNANLSKSYRLPTFNELYWGTWGNPDLKPENGYSEDIGVSYSKEYKKSKFSTNISCFSTNISNWIIWLPVGNIWTPENKNKVWSRGLETELKYLYKIKKINGNINLSYNYTKTTNKEITDISLIGKQLIYVPLHKINCNTFFKYKSYSINYNQKFISKRFITENNENSIDAYTIANVSVGKQILMKNVCLDVNFSINNIFNNNYEIVAWYVMPPRNYMLNVVFEF